MKPVRTGLPLALGVDFSSTPSRQKPVVLAAGSIASDAAGVCCRVEALHHFSTLPALEDFLRNAPAWVGAFDMPFGLSRLLINTLRWPGADAPPAQAWDRFIDFYAALSRAEIREVFKAWCDAHPPGQKFAHRASDRPARSSPSMKWVNPPVAYMLHAGAPLLRRLNAHIPGMRSGDASRVALEAYPALLARRLADSRSYKHDDPRQQTQARHMARSDLVDALLGGAAGVRVQLAPGLESAVREDGKGDGLDAVLCVVQLALAWAEGPHWGLPPDADVLEGWILGAPWRDHSRTPDVMDAARADSIRRQIGSALSAETRASLVRLGVREG